MRGRIIKAVAGFYYTYAEDGEIYACKAKGIFRKEGIKPLVGDEVEMKVTDTKDMEGNVEAIHDRKNSLVRPAVANVDQVFVVFAVADPDPSLLLLDRFLVRMHRYRLPVVICFTKADLAPEKAEELCRIYRGSECRLIVASSRTGQGMQEIRSCLSGKTSVTAGPSGVGKSTIANALQREIQMETGEISRKLGRGRHTTRHVQLVPVSADTFLVDTPGFTSLYLPQMEEEELKDCFPEFYPYEGKCRFLGCRHVNEPDCAVRRAVESGQIEKERYDGYVMLQEELKEILSHRW